MMKLTHLLFGIILLTGFIGCNMEEGRPSKNQRLIIASDCLKAKDTVLFQSFSKSENIRVKILYLSADSIQKYLKKEGLNSTIDAVILSSAFSMYSLDKQKYLEKIQEQNQSPNLLSKYAAKNGNWFGIGIDPFVFITINDSNNRLRTYSDLLKRTNWCTTVSGKAEWYPFYAAIVHKMDPKKDYTALDWVNQFNENKNEITSHRDSNIQCNALLTRYSVFYSGESLSKSRFTKGKLIYPNQRIGGTFYNMICFGIIKQAKNYTNAVQFFEYLMLEPVNKRLNNILYTFPVITSKDSPYAYQNTRYKKYGHSSVQLTSSYSRIENILQILQ